MFKRLLIFCVLAVGAALAGDSTVGVGVANGGTILNPPNWIFGGHATINFVNSGCVWNNSTHMIDCTIAPSASPTFTGTTTMNNVNVTGTACFLPGLTTDGSTVLYKFAKPSGGNYILATTSDTSNTNLTIQTADNTICTTLTANHGMFAHPGDKITVKGDAIGIPDNHWVGASGVTAATAVDCGAFSAAPTCSMVYGYTANGGAIAANATGTMVFTGGYQPVERVITLNLIKSGATGVFPKYKGGNCTIYEIDVQADQSGTFSADIWKTNNAIPAAGNKISASDPASLSAAQISTDTTLTGWTTSVTNNDVFGATVSTFTAVTNVLVQIRCH